MPEFQIKAFSIKNDEADRLVRELKAVTGESLTEAVVCALRERFMRQQRHDGRALAGTELAKLAVKLRRLPVRDARSSDEIVGYDGYGLPN